MTNNIQDKQRNYLIVGLPKSGTTLNVDIAIKNGFKLIIDSKTGHSECKIEDLLSSEFNKKSSLIAKNPTFIMHDDIIDKILNFVSNTHIYLYLRNFSDIIVSHYEMNVRQNMFFGTLKSWVEWKKTTLLDKYVNVEKNILKIIDYAENNKHKNITFTLVHHSNLNSIVTVNDLVEKFSMDKDKIHECLNNKSNVNEKKSSKCNQISTYNEVRKEYDTLYENILSNPIIKKYTL